MIGTLGTFVLVGGASSDPARRNLPPSLFSSGGTVDWTAYFLNERRKAALFGTYHIMFRCPGGSTSGPVSFDQIRALHSDPVDRRRAYLQLSSNVSREHSIYVGSVCETEAMKELAGGQTSDDEDIDLCLWPFLSAGKIVFDASAAAVETDWIWRIAQKVIRFGARPYCESWPHRKSPWWSAADTGVCCESLIYRKYSRPIEQWENAADRANLVPLQDIQCPIDIFVCGPHDDRGEFPTVDDVAAWLARGHNVYVAPSLTTHRWRNQTASTIIQHALSITDG